LLVRADVSEQDVGMTSGERQLVGTSALVTGATSGLGRAVAVRLARAGANVALVGRREGDLAETAEEVRAHGVHALPLPVDLADSFGLADVVDRTVADLGPLGVLVNAAATDVPGSAEEVSLEDWQRVVAVNLTAPFALARAAMPHLRAAGGGLVVNVSSVAGRRGWANASAYCSTKFALTGLTQSLAAEGRADGIRVCVIYPGAMSTNWGTFDPAQARAQLPGPVDPTTSLDPAVVADLIAWMATAPGQPVLNEVTMTPLMEGGWP
jgi:NAD(P)-dependent dehydrogenase (short-subunit alcohol dehydrogenase family)